jgi:hypothetical protein
MHTWLLNISWQQTPRGTLPNDTNQIRRWLRSPSDDVWRRVWPQIKAAWVVAEDRLANAGMIRAAQRQEQYAKRNQKPAKSVGEEEGVFGLGVDFDLLGQQIYELYPRKVKKPQAVVAITRAILREATKLGSQEGAVAYLKVQTEKYADSPFVRAKIEAREEEFIPHPATWFNQEGYNDEEDWRRAGRKQAGPVSKQAAVRARNSESSQELRSMFDIAGPDAELLQPRNVERGKTSMDSPVVEIFHRGSDAGPK